MTASELSKALKLHGWHGVAACLPCIIYTYPAGGTQMKKGMSYISAVLALICFAITASVSKYFFVNVSAISIMAWTSIPAAIFFTFMNGIKGKFKSLSKLGIKAILGMTCIGLVGVMVYGIFVQIGISFLPAQKALVINYLWPAMIIIWMHGLVKESISVGKWCAVLLSFAGVIIVAVDGDISTLLNGSAPGVLACIFAAICYSFYSAAGKIKGYDIELMLMLSYTATVILCMTFSIATGTVEIPNLFVSVGYIIYGFVGNSLGFLFWMIALQYGNTAVISNTAYLTPVFSLFITHFCLGETITAYSVIGLAVILLGVGIQIYLEESP